MMAAGEKQAGFTLIELLVTLVIAVILVTIAVPSYQDLVVRNRLSADFNQMLAGLHYARSEAVKKREDISVQVSGSWQMVIQDSASKTLRLVESQGEDISASPSDFNVTFNALGRRTSCSSPCGVSLAHSGYDDSKSLTVNPAGNISR